MRSAIAPTHNPSAKNPSTTEPRPGFTTSAGIASIAASSPPADTSPCSANAWPYNSGDSVGFGVHEVESHE